MTAPTPYDADPLSLVAQALERARAVEPADPTAMTLATADASGRPSARMVLLKSVDARGVVFFSNRESRKGRELAANPRAALCIHWPTLAEQIRVEGDVELVGDAESDAYFSSRARESQLGAWVSQQSRPVASREDLDTRFREVTERFAGEPVPRPPYWGGYRLVPTAIELWKNGAFRLHDRFRYERVGDAWRSQRLQP